MVIHIVAVSEAWVSVVGAALGMIFTFLLWLADRYGLAWMLMRSHENELTGRWYGWSVYIPVDGFFSRDSEAIYRTVVDFKQRGRHVRFVESLTEIYDIHGERLTALAPRRFAGRGHLGGHFDLSATFSEVGGLTIGSMHVVADTRARELTGILAVRPRIPGRPVAVKILLRRAGEDMPDWSELGLPAMQALAEAGGRN